MNKIQEIQQLLCMLVIFHILGLVLWETDYRLHNLLGFGVFWLAIENLLQTNEIVFPLILAFFGILSSLFSTFKQKQKRSKK